MLYIGEGGERDLVQAARWANLSADKGNGEAKTLLDKARQEHDQELLERLVQQYLASSSGDEAALLLGDAALARGDAVAARRSWLKLHAALRTTEEAAQQLGVYPGLPWFFALRAHANASSFLLPRTPWGLKIINSISATPTRM